MMTGNQQVMRIWKSILIKEKSETNISDNNDLSFLPIYKKFQIYFIIELFRLNYNTLAMPPVQFQNLLYQPIEDLPEQGEDEYQR